MKLLFNLYQFNLGLILFLFVWFKPFSSVAAVTIKIISNSHDLDLDNYAITLRYVPTHSLNQNTIKQSNSFSENINQRENYNVLTFLKNLQTQGAELPKIFNQFESQLFTIGEVSFPGKNAVDDIGSLRSLYSSATLASVAVWQANLVRGFVVTVPLNSYTFLIQDFPILSEGWGNSLFVTNNFTQEVERAKPLSSLSNNFQDLKLSNKRTNPSWQPVVPILPQVAYKDIYKGIYDFDINIIDKPEHKYNFVVN